MNIMDLLRKKKKILVEEEAPLEEKKKVETNKIFRPKTFDEYIGQEKAKHIFKKYITGIKKRELVFPHFLISGQAGTGKTTLVQVIANSLLKNFMETITSEIWGIEKIMRMITDSKNGVVFLDEIHSLPREIAEKLYSIMEDFKYNGDKIDVFTLAGATTELGEILKNRKPFYDRFKIIIELEDYTLEELIKIIMQYNGNVFADDILSEENIKIISKNCRGVPRNAIRLLESTVYFDGDIEQVLYSFNILKDGYTKRDLKTLLFILNNDKVGMQSLASYLNTSQQNYLYEIEPYLLKNELIERTPRGRKVTEKGINQINILQ